MSNDRDEAIARIKAALKRRSGKSWSVTGGKGTAWGWIEINVPPARRTWTNVPKPHNVIRLDPGRENWDEVDTGKPGGFMGPPDRDELAKLLGLPEVHFQGVSIAASSAYREEYISRAEGRTPAKIAEPYWD